MYQKSALTHLSQHMNITPPAAWEQLKTLDLRKGVCSYFHWPPAMQLSKLITACWVGLTQEVMGTPLSNGGQLALVTLKLTCHIHITVLLLTALLNIWFTLSVVLYSNSALQTDGCEKGTVALNAHNIFVCYLVKMPE